MIFPQKTIAELWDDPYKLIINLDRDNVMLQDLLPAYPDLLTFHGDNGKTLLDYAVTLGFSKVARLLLDAGADPNHVNTYDSNNTPLIYAITGMDTNSAELLHQHGASLTHQSQAFGTALHAACYLDCTDGVAWLLEHDVPINIQRDNGDTPLHAAAAAGLDGMVMYLLELGADPAIANQAGDYPEDVTDDPDTQMRLRGLRIQREQEILMQTGKASSSLHARRI